MVVQRQDRFAVQLLREKVVGLHSMLNVNKFVPGRQLDRDGGSRADCVGCVGTRRRRRRKYSAAVGLKPNVSVALERLRRCSAGVDLNKSVHVQNGTKPAYLATAKHQMSVAREAVNLRLDPHGLTSRVKPKYRSRRGS